MKKSMILALMVSLCLNLNAQTKKASEHRKIGYVQKMDSLFENLDKSKIETGILYDRVVPFAQLDQFNAKQDTANFKLFRQAWSELYNASYNPDFEDFQKLNNALKANEKPDEVIMGLIHMPFQIIIKNDEKGKKKNFKIKNGKLEAIKGKPLYDEKRIVMLTPMKEKVYGNEITFNFIEDFQLQKQNSVIQELKVDFGNGVEQYVIRNGKYTNESITVKYQSLGKKILQFKVTLKNQEEITTYSEIQTIEKVIINDPLVEDHNIKANIAFKGYDESVAIKGKNEYRTFYRTANGNTSPSLQKPIIILDGFDPLDERQINDSDPGHDPEQPSILELMRYGNNNNGDLIFDLREDGYDVIIVNHPRYQADETGQYIQAGGDFIERNAMVLIALIQRVNNELSNNSSSEELVVVGPSMGGLISRYALAYMEKHNMDHNTRLWVSFDSPHLGANIPIAIHQALHFFAYAGGNEDATETFEKVLTSTAAKQMLIEQFGALNNTANFRQQFMTKLENNGLSGSNGFPVNLRKVSLLNGTTLGKGNNSLGQKFLDLKGKALGVKVAEVVTNFMKAHNVKNRTFKGTVGAASWWEPSAGITWIETETTNANPNGSMDVTAGAYNNTGKIMRDKFIDGFNEKDLNITSDYHLPNHTFIPTVSALALENPNYNWSNALNRNLVCTGETPFDSYYAPENNQQHITVTSENVDWIMEEINGNPQAPVVRLFQQDLAGSERLCYNQLKTYSFGNCKLGSPVTSWNTTTNLNIMSSSSSNITVKEASSSFRGNKYITANFADGTSLTKKVWVGRPADPSPVQGSTDVVPNAWEYYSVPAQEEASSYTWNIPSGWSFHHTSSTTSNQVLLVTGSSSGYVAARANNECGVSNYRSKYVTVSGDDCGSPVCYFTYSPNPVEETLTVEMEPTTFDLRSNDTYKISLNNQYGKVVYEAESNSICHDIDMKKLPKGMYRIVVSHKDKQQIAKILKQ
ncbi:T9SS type A sorting domain-containing protein [Marivirga sp.]|uniref:T9SS type A sorting domain-containing protein n=1 Tax=Marivirga sp. TaxID=2018662 RepID=UPI003DA762CD